MTSTKDYALLFGSSGALGSAILAQLEQHEFHVITAGSSPGRSDHSHLQLDYKQSDFSSVFDSIPQLSSVVWAQGINCSDSVTCFDLNDLQRLFQSNVLFVASTLRALLQAKKLASGSRLAVVSSIWQLESRPGKFSYSVSKAALQGLVKSCAIDLGPMGILINAVLPGVVDTPMTRTHLSAEQIATITSQSALQRLPEPEDIATAVCFLVGASNRAITGQFLTVDAGFIGMKHA
jgi:NAD(P)-dependent dehydrogenase (short-subunit alcohol dehydrogenase family)